MRVPFPAASMTETILREPFVSMIARPIISESSAALSTPDVKASGQVEKHAKASSSIDASACFSML
jgi:hypothetical protein